MIDLDPSSSRTSPRKKKRTEHGASFLAPIVGSIILSAIFTLLMISATAYVPPVGIVSESEGGVPAAGINAMFLSVLPLIGGLVILVILRKRKRFLLKAFIGTAFFIAGFAMFLMIIASAIRVISGWIEWDLAYELAVPLSLELNIISVYIILSGRVSQGPKNVVAVLYGGGIGTLLGTALLLWTGLLMVVGISIYDIYSVRSGPIKEIVKVSKEGTGVAIPGLSYVSRDWEIGLGDLGIYSMIISLAQKWYGLIACVSSMIGIFIGSVLTLQLLKRREFLPGLPLTSLIGATPIAVFMIFSLST